MTLEETCSNVRAYIASGDEASDGFDAIARQVFAFQFEHNAAYRAFCLSRGTTPDRIEFAEQIPAIITTAFKDFDLTVLPEEARSIVFHSSGTTQHRPSRHYHSAQTLQVYHDSLLPWFRTHLCPGVNRFNFLVLSPRMEGAPHSSLVHMFETIAKAFGVESRFVAEIGVDGGWELEIDAILEAQKRFAQSNLPVLVCGTAFSFVHLCDNLREMNRTLNLPPGSRVFETGGYKGRSRTVEKSELHRLISQSLSIPETQIVTEYGMSELSSQAYDRVAGQSGPRRFKFPHWARASVISPETGEPVRAGEVGLTRIIDLANVGSVVSVQTEDLALRHTDGFELVGRASEAEARGCSLMQVAG